MQSCFHLDLALKLKGINIAMGGGGEGALRLLFRFGNRVLGGRGEISTECLNLFATACRTFNDASMLLLCNLSKQKVIFGLCK